METRISSSSMDNANKIKTSVMLLLLYGICIFPAWDGTVSYTHLTLPTTPYV